MKKTVTILFSIIIIAIIGIWAYSLIPEPPNEILYTIMDLGEDEPLAINNLGQILMDGEDHDYLRLPDGDTQLIAHKGQALSAKALDNRGRVLVLRPTEESGTGDFFVWSATADLLKLPKSYFDANGQEYELWFPSALNSHDTLAGTVGRSTDTACAVLNATSILWATMTGNALLTDINDRGHILYGNGIHSVTGLLTRIEEPNIDAGFLVRPKMKGQFLEGMNEREDVVGGFGYIYPWIRSQDGFWESIVAIINDGPTEQKDELSAYLWDNSGYMNLNSAIDNTNDWTVDMAIDINDQGQIVGTGSLRGKYRSFLLTPIEGEP